ncbi:MAG: DUF2341 domain-containing protein [Methanococcoides sp.]|nr:DUF2341 domain-containing protein [Methanococcoides sp.]
MQELRVLDNTVDFYLDDVYVGNSTLDPDAPTSGKTGFWSQYGEEGYRDEHIVRRYAFPEPMTVMGSKECWYEISGYKKKITINHTMVEGDLTDFPVLINILSDSDLVAHAQADGDDILFTDSDNNKLSHELEEFNVSTGKLVSWVKVPELSSTVDTDIYMHYGNPSCESQANASDVWDNNFVMVQHLNEESGTHYDSSSYSNDGSPQNNVTQNATGLISGADDFDGINDFIEVAHDDSLNMTDEMIIEAWIYPHQLSSYKVMLDKTTTNLATNYYFSVNNGTMNYGFYSGGWHESATSNIISNDTWYHVVAVYNDTADSLRVYVDGDEKYNDTESNSLTTNSDSLVIGDGNPDSGEQFDGIIDELRISNKARSQSWINTSYNSQYSSSTFYDIGVEGSGCTTTTGTIASQVLESSHEHRNKKITIDHTKVEGELTDFPVLISLSTDADLAAHTQNDGDDIFFTAADDTRLSHEIEEYNSSTGELVAWVKIPSLSNTTDTAIYMQYGDQSCGSQEDVTGVWDSNFLMVQHLNNLNSTATEDSTSNNYDGIKTAIDEPLEVDGMVGNAQYFDGSNDHVNVGVMDHNIGYGNYTWSVWAKTPDVYNDINPIMTNGNYAPAIYTKTYQNTQWGTYYGSYRLAGNVLSLNTWYHLVVQRENGIVRFYQDGVLLPTTHAFSFSMANSEFYIGRSGVGWYGRNTVDEARVSNTVRSESWVKTSYNNQFSPSTFYSVGQENSPVKIDGLFWDETLASGTDISFEIRASDTLFLKGDEAPSWTSIGSTSPVTSGLPSGKYVQWRATLTSAEGNTPMLHEVRLYYSE